VTGVHKCDLPISGSDKSNTLHKLFLELFRSKYYENIIKKSQFFIIDFNGEYIRENMFAVKEGDKEIFEINTRSEKQGRKLPIKRDRITGRYAGKNKTLCGANKSTNS